MNPLSNTTKSSSQTNTSLELLACSPKPVELTHFNPHAVLPYGLTIEHIYQSMQDFAEFLGLINSQLHTKKIERLETMLMQANFSSIVGEFMTSRIPRHCPTLVKNRYHNGHPDLIPANRFPNNAIQHSSEGIEVKSSRYVRGWQGHNQEDTWLMVFVFDANSPVDVNQGVSSKPFSFLSVVGAEITRDDWQFSGRSETSRRTITASVKRSGFDKMMKNWIYRDPTITVSPAESSQSPQV